MFRDSAAQQTHLVPMNSQPDYYDQPQLPHPTLVAKSLDPAAGPHQLVLQVGSTPDPNRYSPVPTAFTTWQSQQKIQPQPSEQQQKQQQQQQAHAGASLDQLDVIAAEIFGRAEVLSKDAALDGAFDTKCIMATSPSMAKVFPTEASLDAIAGEIFGNADIQEKKQRYNQNKDDVAQPYIKKSAPDEKKQPYNNQGEVAQQQSPPDEESKNPSQQQQPPSVSNQHPQPQKIYASSIRSIPSNLSQTQPQLAQEGGLEHQQQQQKYRPPLSSMAFERLQQEHSPILQSSRPPRPQQCQPPPTDNNYGPDPNKDEWLHRISSAFWPYFKNYLATSLVNVTEPVIRSALPFKIASFRFDTLDFGLAPPKIYNIRCVTQVEKQEQHRQQTQSSQADLFKLASGQEGIAPTDSSMDPHNFLLMNSNKQEYIQFLADVFFYTDQPSIVFSIAFIDDDDDNDDKDPSLKAGSFRPATSTASSPAQTSPLASPYSAASSRKRPQQIVVGISKILIQGKISVILKPILDTFPFLGAVHVSFTETPKMKFGYIYGRSSSASPAGTNPDKINRTKTSKLEMAKKGIRYFKDKMKKIGYKMGVDKMLESIIEKVMKVQITTMMVYPNAVVMKLINNDFDAPQNVSSSKPTQNNQDSHHAHLNTQGITNFRKIADSVQGVATIQILEASGISLPSHGKGFRRRKYRDTYVKVKIASLKLKTSVEQDTLNPKWSNASFEFCVEYDYTPVKIEWWDVHKSKPGQPELLGQTSLFLHELYSFHNQNTWIPLKDISNSNSLKVLMRPCFFKVSIERPLSLVQTKNSQTSAIFTILLERATNLPQFIMGTTKEISPRVRILFDHGGHERVYESSTVSNKFASPDTILPRKDISNPFFEEPFHMFWTQPYPVKIRFDVCSGDTVIARAYHLLPTWPHQAPYMFDGDLNLCIQNQPDLQTSALHVFMKMRYLHEGGMTLSAENEVKSAEQSEAESENENSDNEDEVGELTLDTAEEHYDWINLVISALWPKVSAYVARETKKYVEPILQSNAPAVAKAIHFKSLTLGTKPLHISNFFVTTYPDGMEIRANVEIESDSKVILSMDKAEYINVGVENFMLKGRISCHFKPFNSEPPFFSALQMCFVDIPEIEMKFSCLADVAEWYFIKPMVKDLIMKEVAQLIVAPNRAFLPAPEVETALEVKVNTKPADLALQVDMEVSVKNYEEYNVPNYGIIRVGLEKAEKLLNMDYAPFKSDPYALISIGATERRSKTINNNLNPVWNESNFYFVCSAPDQMLNIELWDEDIGKRDDFLGRCSVCLVDFVGRGFQWLTFEDDIPGRVSIKADLQVLDERPLLNGIGNLERPASSSQGVLTIILEKLVDIPTSRTSTYPICFVEMILFLDEANDNSWEVGRTTAFPVMAESPKWNQTLHIPFGFDKNERFVAWVQKMQLHCKLKSLTGTIFEWKTKLIEAECGEPIKGRRTMRIYRVGDGTWQGAGILYGVHLYETKKNSPPV